MAISKGKKSDDSTRLRRRKVVYRLFFKVVIIGFCLWFFFVLGSYILREIAIGQIVDLTGAKVSTDSLKIGLDGRVVIKGLCIRPHSRQYYGGPILEAEKVEATFDVASLLVLRPRLKQIVVHGFVFDALYDLDLGRWNLAALKMAVPRSAGGKAPVVKLEKGKLRYGRVSNGRVQIVASLPVEVSFGPSEDAKDAYNFNITTAERPFYGKSTLKGYCKPGIVVATGSIASADLAAFERVWTVRTIASQLTYDRHGNYSLKLRIKDLISVYRPDGGVLALDSEYFLGKTDPITALQRFFERYRPAGSVDVEADIRGRWGRPASTKFEGVVHCKDISICDRKFPYPIENINGDVVFNNGFFKLKGLRGRHGEVEVTLKGSSKDFGPGREYEITFESKNMKLDKDLYEALGGKEKKLWSDFSPSGKVAVIYHVEKQRDRAKSSTLAVELLGVDAVYRGFPYPLKNLRGHIFYKGNTIVASEIVSQFDDRWISINGKVSITKGPARYEFNVNGKNIPLDSALKAALPKRQRLFLDDLSLEGLADVEIKLLSSPDRVKKPDFVAEVFLKQASMKLLVPKENLSTNPVEAKGPFFPIQDVKAKIVITPKLVGIEHLQGMYGRAKVSMRGRIWPGNGDKSSRYSLRLEAEQLNLDETLTELAPASIRDVILRLEPSGKMNLKIDLTSDGRDFSDFELVLDCLGNGIKLPIDSGRYCWHFQEVKGRLRIKRDYIRLDKVSGVPVHRGRGGKNARVEVDGEIALDNGTFKKGSFRIQGYNFPVDSRLVMCLPDNLRRLCRNLSPAGRLDFNLQNLDVVKGPEGEKQVDFDGSITVKNGTFNVLSSFSELNSRLRIKCSYNGVEGIKQCRLSVDGGSVRIRGKLLKALEADVYYEPEQNIWRCRNLTADFYGGDLIGRFDLKEVEATGLEYSVEVAFENADLGQFLADTSRRQDFETGGKMSGSLCLSGCTRTDNEKDIIPPEAQKRNSCIGRCRLTITDMKAGKVSPLAKLLYVLQLTEPDNFIFDQMMLDSYLKKDRLFLKDLDISGRAVAFTGSGWIDPANEQVNLVLYARNRRLAMSEPSVLQSLTENLGFAVVRLEVTGSIYDPKIKTKPLPVLKDTLRIFGTGR